MKLKSVASATLTLIATLVSSMATAQSTVTLYGALDVGLVNQSTTAAGYSTTLPGSTNNLGSVTKMQDGGIGASFFGFRGTEDLGGGWTAKFQLQGNLSLDTGNTATTSGAISPTGPAFFNQIAVVGLAGEFGEVKIGRQIAPMFQAMAYTDPREGRYFGSILGTLVGVNSTAGWAGSTTNAPLGAVYEDNTIVYTTPKIGGVTANLQYTLGEIAGNTSAASRKSVTLLYGVDALKLSAVYYSANDAYTVPTRANGTNNNRWLHLGASYALKDFTLSGSYSSVKNPAGTPSGVGVINAANPALGNTIANANFKIASMGVGYKIAPQYRITTGYYRITDQTTSGNKSALLSAGLDIALSKRSMLYLQAGRVNNDGSMNQALMYGVPVAGGKSTTGYMVGVRHTF